MIGWRWSHSRRCFSVGRPAAEVAIDEAVDEKVAGRGPARRVIPKRAGVGVTEVEFGTRRRYYATQ